MYKTILIPLDHSPTDQIIIDHIRPLARLLGSRLVLLHVADGFVARHQERENLHDSPEISEDRAYLEERGRELRADGFSVAVILERGEPSKKLLQVADSEQCDLIAMATHGHGFIKDLLLGSVADNIRHRTSTPILMIRAQR